MSRTAPALASTLLVLLLSAPDTVAQNVPRTPADSLAGVIEPLFVAAKYDSILALIPFYLRRAEATHDSVLLGRAITQRGRVMLMLGRRDEAVTDIDFGIRTAEAVRDTFGLMPAVHFRGFAYSMAGDYETAMSCFERRLHLAQRVRSPVDEAWARSSMGYVYHRRSDNVRAREQYTRAITLFRGTGLERLEITPLIGLGRVEIATGREREAIRCYQRAWVVAREVGDRVNEMWATNNLGVLEASRGDLSRAAQYQQRAYDLARELKFASGMVIPAINVADRAEELGDFETSEAILRETREVCESQGAEEFLGMVDFRVAELRMKQDRYRSAAALFRRLLTGPDALEPQHREFAVLDLATILARNDSVPAAIDLLSQHLSRPDIYRDVVAPASMTLSRLYAETNDGEKALAYALRARADAQRAGRTRSVISAMLRESVCRRMLGQSDQATQTLYAALDSLEAFRGGISTAEWREVYGAQVASGVVDAGRVLLEYPPALPRSEREEAFFDAMQRVKTRTLLDRITEPRFGAEEIEGRWSRRVAAADDLQAVLQPGEVVLDFYVGSDQSFVVAVTSDSLRVVELPGPDSPLAERVRLFRSLLASADPELREQYPVERMVTLQRALGHDVLGGVIDIIEASTRVFVAPDDYFSAIPFGILIKGESNSPLMATRDIIQVPSASVLVLQRSIRRSECVSDPNLVAIASSEPRLAGARDEVRELARRYGDVEEITSLTDAESFQGATQGCDVLHVAAHARVIDRSPWESGIRLASESTGTIDEPREGTRAVEATSGILSASDSLLVANTFQADPYLRAWQIAQLSLPAKLAVLSACETAGGRVTSGEGTLGITAAFLSAGVPVVVSSLWPIDDRVTARLMRAFYRNLARGEPVATALRLAQVELSRSREHAHPFYWAGFTVVGDGSMVIEIEEHRAGANPVVLAALGAAVLGLAALVVRRRRPAARVG